MFRRAVNTRLALQLDDTLITRSRRCYWCVRRRDTVSPGRKPRISFAETFVFVVLTSNITWYIRLLYFYLVTHAGRSWFYRTVTSMCKPTYEVCPENIKLCSILRKMAYVARWSLSPLELHAFIPASLPLLETVCDVLFWNSYQLSRGLSRSSSRCSCGP